MNIHFYHEWDKQENGRSEESSKLARLWDTNKGMILLLSLSILCVFWFTFFLYGDDNGQAMLVNQEHDGTAESIPVAKPEGLLYTVKPGDTLWAIAGQFYPERTREEAVQLIRESNGFSGPTIHAGQTILLP
ncbi:LysM peptidoglycan-binding domain-containing protein [Ammoniphilus sp. 3BR4]|uniref:LysM peptidoglycan-binding domain-containing protein n=1 Tax=Ammoniphilus sp. 3BR4 TaxID=3158265 RepID=UPI00346651B2